MIVIDTHVWLWMDDDPGRLSTRAVGAIAHAESLLVSPISVWELAMLVEKQRLDLGGPVLEWVRSALAVERTVYAPLPPEVATLAAELGTRGFHGDPADRLITATALHFGAPLVTKDHVIREWGGVPTVW